ncbi:acyltransferase [Microtetraspora sp. NBRC 13810]|uniref:acyltransferase family protein n=1 Tax=Microtetraspora sp. NBRC 13810 TaxID=3030990 RepID=UPI0024A212A2|nr:acyltransferase [Microtetraspora sp. NBRC 13810]GLW11010.1 acyltransferase [Microtetraspora sp. NBRC 13810]
MTVLLDRPLPAARPPAAVSSRPRPALVRDPFIDVLRLFGIALVVLQHWSIPVLSYTSGHIVTGNAFATPGAAAITWLTQVMPLVFFAGGAANALSLRASLPSATSTGPSPSAPGRSAVSAALHAAGPAWLARRLRRLAWPVLALAAVWIPLPHVLLTLGLPAQPVEVGARLAGQLLWFLAVYLIAVTLTPLMLRAHARHGLLVPALLAAGAIPVDVARFATGVEWLGYLNILFVWLAVHQLGFFHAENRLTRPVPLAVGGFGAAALLVAYGPYPMSMIGLPGAAVSNMAPPTLAMLAVAAGQIGLATLLRPYLTRLGRHRLIGWAGSRIMTVYLWHMPALFLVTGVVVVGFGVATPAPGSLAWFAGWPLWLALLALAIYPLLRVFTRFEQPPALPYGKATWPGMLTAAALIGGGLLTLTVAGFAPGLTPVAALVALAGGLLLTAPAART